ncbi:MAG: hypothetical protein FJX59_15275 [Alphaproteobacteria bacterium]|nr:hypothetical protein [Alphaproteobacteria bacterium]
MRPAPMLAAGLAATTLVLVILNAYLVFRNQGIEAEVQQRQLIINQSLQVSQVSNVLLQMLGQTVVNTKDPAIQSLLGEFGITVTENAPAAPAAPAAAPQ